MLRILSTLILSLTVATGAAAQSEGDAFDLGTDRFRAGSEVRFEASGAGDVFLAGERITLAAPIDGSAHLAGRLIEVEGDVAAALYAMGYDLAVSAPVGGAATLAGYAIRVDAPVAGNLRATGMRVTLAADVGGAALLAGRDIEIEGTIAGDAVLAAETLSFGPDARIEGQVTLYSDDDVDLDVPSSVAPPERIDRRSLAEYQGDERAYMRMTLGERIAAFGGAVLALTLITTLAVTIAPQGFDRLRKLVGEAPWRALGTGFLALSLLFGAAFMLILTVIGIVVAPVALIAALLLSIAGYTVAVYLLGVWLVTRGNMMEPDTFPEFALTALAGALVAGLLALVPFLGWVVPPALALTGAGALTLAAFGRRLGY